MIVHFILYLLVVLAGIIFSVLYTRYVILIVVAALALVPVVSFLCSLISSFFVKIEVDMEEAFVHKNNDFSVTFQIKNSSYLPIPFAKVYYEIGYPEYVRAKKDVFSLNLPARSEIRQTLNLRSEYAGMLHIRVRMMKYFDIFRVFACYQFPKIQEMKLVYPDMEKIEGYDRNNNRFIEGESEEYYDNQSGDDPSQVFDIRDYREGDRLQRIHWKLSSKRDKLLVKEFSKPIVIQNVIVCDFSMQADKMDAVKKRSAYYEKAVSLSFSLLEDDIVHYAVWYDAGKEVCEVRKILEETDLYHFIYELGEAKSYPVSNLFCEKWKQTDLDIDNLAIFYVGERGIQWEEQGIKVVGIYDS